MKKKEWIELLSSDVAGINSTQVETNILLERIAIAVEQINTRDGSLPQMTEDDLTTLRRAMANQPKWDTLVVNTDIQDDAATRMYEAMQKPGAHSAQVVPLDPTDGPHQANVWVDPSTGHVWVRKPDYDELRKELDNVRAQLDDYKSIAQDNKNELAASRKAHEIEVRELKGELKLAHKQYAEAVEQLYGWRRKYEDLYAEVSGAPHPTYQDPAVKQEGARIMAEAQDALREDTDHSHAHGGFEQTPKLSYDAPRKIKDNPQA